MVKTIIALLAIGGISSLATLTKFGTSRSGSAYIEKTMRQTHRGTGRGYYGGGYGRGK